MLPFTASSTNFGSRPLPVRTYFSEMDVNGLGYPYSGLAPLILTLIEVTSCFLLRRTATMSMPEQAPREASSAFIGVIPLGTPFSGTSKTIEWPDSSLPRKT